MSAERAARLARLALPASGVIGLAVDHRDSLREAAAARGVPSGDDRLRELKRRVLDALATEASMVLLDEELGGELVRDGAIPEGVGLVMPLEAQGYEAVGTARVTRLLDDFGPADAARLGADGCKLLLPIRADDVRSTAAQERVTIEALAACHAAELPLVCEPIVHRLPDENPETYAAHFGELVVEASQRLAGLGVDLLKVQYPGTPDACRALDAALSGVPWVLLGGGEEPDVLEQQLTDACQAGASGIMVGRTAWDAGLVTDAEESSRRLASIARPLFARYRAIVERWARPLIAG